MPTLLGSDEPDALAQLEAIGLVVTIERVASYDAEPGIVLATEPAGAAELDTGASVTMTVALRPSECNDAPAEIPGAAFGDIAGLGAEAAASIDWAVAVGLVSEGAAFGPSDAMTRGAATTILWRYMCQPLTQGLATSFADVSADSFYAAAVGWASARGIVGGTTPTTFGPDEAITRAAFITIVWRALDQPTDDTALPFTDVDPAAFYTPAVQWAVGVGLVNGTTPTTFAPDDPLSRITTVILFDRIERNVDPLVG